jgi:molybdenum cofactor synthesis domain-containing protein
MSQQRNSTINVSRARIITRKSLKIEILLETIPVPQSLGRVLARPVVASHNDPHTPKSAMDGYAVRARDIYSASHASPVILHRTASIALGEEQKQYAGPETCVWVPTGGSIPPYYDSVVPVEQANEENSRVMFTSGINEGSNIDPVGHYHKRGEILVQSGAKLSSRDIAILASLGIREIEVTRKPGIGIVSTGNELIPSEAPRDPDRIYDSNGQAIASLFEETGNFTTRYYGIIGDDEDKISNVLNRMVAENDLVVTTGGTSKGDKDLLPNVLSGLTPGIQFQGMKVKPGKPTIFALSGKIPVIALPGPPVSSYLVMFDIFLPIILSKLGIKSFSLPVKAKLSEDARISRGKYNIVPVDLQHSDEPRAKPLQGSSSAISRLSRANGYFTYEGDLELLGQGTEVMVKPFVTSVF